MALPYYVSPEQFMKDKSDYAQKGITKGKSVIVMNYAQGIVLIAENPSQTLHKISEIYDRMAFAGVGKFNEFESLRMHGIRQADVHGYQFSRGDVTAQRLANTYSQALGQIFTDALKPFEVEILVAQLGDTSTDNQLFHILYDGSVTDEDDFVAMGGQAEQLTEQIKSKYKQDLPLGDAVKACVQCLASVGEKSLAPGNIEAAVLDRALPERRKFRRLTKTELDQALA